MVKKKYKNGKVISNLRRIVRFLRNYGRDHYDISQEMLYAPLSKLSKDNL